MNERARARQARDRRRPARSSPYAGPDDERPNKRDPRAVSFCRYGRYYRDVVSGPINMEMRPIDPNEMLLPSGAFIPTCLSYSVSNGLLFLESGLMIA